MQLKSLYIKDYKMLKDFHMEFNQPISLLIGKNGSGKSTVLEALALIFSDIIENKDSRFGFKIIYDLILEEIVDKTSTIIEFKTDYNTVEISSNERGGEISFKVHIAKKVLETKEDIEREFKEIYKILPSNIIIYYSGFTEVMKKICKPHDDLFSRQYREGQTNIYRPFFYFKPILFDLILITLLSYEYGDIPFFLLEKARIRSFQSIQIKLKKPDWVRQQKIANWWGARGEVKDFLDFLNRLEEPLVLKDEGSKEIVSNGNVIIEAWENEALTITIIGQHKLFQIREHFLEEKNLFNILNALYIDGFLAGVEFALINSENKMFRYLSEGEQQILTIKGLTEFVSGQNSLLLFDEPDTYLHPSWQREFLKNFESIVETDKAHLVVASHSPIMIANMKHGDLYKMQNGQAQLVKGGFYGKDYAFTLENYMGTSAEVEETKKDLERLFNFIENDKLKDAQSLLEELNQKYPNEPELTRAQTMITLLTDED